MQWLHCMSLWYWNWLIVQHRICVDCRSAATTLDKCAMHYKAVLCIRHIWSNCIHILSFTLWCRAKITEWRFTVENGNLFSITEFNLIHVVVPMSKYYQHSGSVGSGLGDIVSQWWCCSLIWETTFACKLLFSHILLSQGGLSNWSEWLWIHVDFSGDIDLEVLSVAVELKTITTDDVTKVEHIEDEKVETQALKLGVHLRRGQQ